MGADDERLRHMGELYIFYEKILGCSSPRARGPTPPCWGGAVMRAYAPKSNWSFAVAHSLMQPRQRCLTAFALDARLLIYALSNLALSNLDYPSIAMERCDVMGCKAPFTVCTLPHFCTHCLVMQTPIRVASIT